MKGALKKLAFLSLLFLVLVATGCGSVAHKAKFQSEFPPDSKLKVGQMNNETGQSFDVEITTMMSEAFTAEFKKQGYLFDGQAGPLVTIDSQIVKYEKGNAFKRWLLPGYGSTVLTIQCEVKDANGNLLGTVDAHRKVSAGGLYTVGAWKSIFNDVAKDVAKELKAKGLKKG